VRDEGHVRARRKWLVVLVLLSVNLIIPDPGQGSRLSALQFLNLARPPCCVRTAEQQIGPVCCSLPHPTSRPRDRLITTPHDRSKLNSGDLVVAHQGVRCQASPLTKPPQSSYS
jgi:hypothetical protein